MFDDVAGRSWELEGGKVEGVQGFYIRRISFIAASQTCLNLMDQDVTYETYFLKLLIYQ